MINLDQILKEAIRSNASDIHLVMGKRPMLRISKSLNEMEDQDILQEDDMYEILAAMDAFITDYSSAAHHAIRLLTIMKNWFAGC